MIKSVLQSLNPTDQASCLNYICKNEGFRPNPYDDATGLRVKAPRGVLTVGHGINLDSGLSVSESSAIVLNRLCDVESDLLSNLVWFIKLSAVRKIALLDMGYNLGVGGLLRFTTPQHDGFLDYMGKADYVCASGDLKGTAWYTQVKGRAVADAYMILNNAWMPPQ